ncbi:MBOAT family protein [bacterium]|nr:MBOAT family protein [bacterium]
MEIISIQFILLSIISIFIYYSLNQKYRIAFLTLVSCAFIGSLSLNLLIYILIFSGVNYLIGIRLPEAKFKKALFRFGIIINVLQIIILKYADFAIHPLFNVINLDLNFNSLSKLIVPIGISYFTLQGIGYLINVKMGWEKPEKRILNFILYLSFYPKFLSGPIERSNKFLPQLNVSQQFSREQVVVGLKIVLFGIFKKVAIANQLAPFIQGSWNHLDSVGGSVLWATLLIQPIYLYFDFSGYTDIAIGIAKTFGINLLPNFNRPFFSENMTTFWKRFHITLGAWFNDYVFKQTAFRRRKWGIYSSIYALMISWTLFGIWHGAGWNFMFLGLLQAAAIIYEFFTKRWRTKVFPKLTGNKRIWFSRILTYLFYCVSLVFFFSPSLNTAFAFFTKLATSSQVPQFFYREDLFALVLGLSFMFIFLLFELIQNDYRDTYAKIMQFWHGETKKKMLFRWAIYYVIIILIFVTTSKVEQFVYIQF